MNQCPECQRPMQSLRCACGWVTAPDPAYDAMSPDPVRCVTCAAILDKRKEYRPHDTSWPVNHCFMCGAHDASVKDFMTDTPCLADRGVRMCSSCWIPALKRRSTCEHAWAQGHRDGEKCERCALQIEGDRALFREYMRQIEART